jgi:hypothetical protein
LLDVLDLVMRERADQVLDFTDPTVPNGSLAASGTPFGQPLTSAFDEAMTRAEWMAFTRETADTGLRNGCIEIWRVYVMPGSRPGVGGSQWAAVAMAALFSWQSWRSTSDWVRSLACSICLLLSSR